MVKRKRNRFSYVRAITTSFVGRAVMAYASLLMPSLAMAEVTVNDFGKTSDGTPVKQYTITNSQGVVVKLISRGATLQEWHVPDKNGQKADVVFGFDKIAD